jgi:uncharacterized protein YecT (DUF1311 family)
MNDASAIRLIGFISIFLSVASLQAQTQAGMNADARADFAKADVDLNKTYQAVLAKLPTAEKEKLKEAQRAWIASRDAKAARAAKEAEGGSIAATIRYETMTGLTRKRIVELNAMIDKATAGALQQQSPEHEEAEPVAFEKIQDVSPDGKFGVRVSCSSEPSDPNNIDSSLISAVRLVALPSKKIVMDLQNYDGSPAHVIWSQDSKWLAYGLSSGPRVIDTYVYHRAGDDFNELKTEGLRVDVKGDVRNEYVQPVRWLQPAILSLEQYDIFRGGEGRDTTYRFAVKFDDKTGKFQITSKEKVQKE